MSLSSLRGQKGYIMKPYVQFKSNDSTLEHWKQILDGNGLNSFAAFAYVTESGVAQLGTHLGKLLKGRDCRWLFSIDYGRSHPNALRNVTTFGKSEVRIYDGAYVVDSKSFVPRLNYHLKTALTLQADGYPSQQVVGSGNLSASGLSSGVEAGCLVDYSQVEEAHGTAVIARLENLWQDATPLADVVDAYEKQYVEVSQPQTTPAEQPPVEGVTSLFWIDVGYVTKNRGPEKPGNQFDLPRGSHIYLGVTEVKAPLLNSVLADLKIRTPFGEIIERRLRYGNKAMEKLTLPIPEHYGYECYDGKILTFRITEGQTALEAFEHEDFFQIYGMYISSCSQMQSGRKYGTIALPY